MLVGKDYLPHKDPTPSLQGSKLHPCFGLAIVVRIAAIKAWPITDTCRSRPSTEVNQAHTEATTSWASTATDFTLDIAGAIASSSGGSDP